MTGIKVKVLNKHHKPDRWAQKAKQLGFPARSVFKLQEIQHKWKILKKGESVLDIGASPGSWSLYTLKTLGYKTRVIAIDLQELSITLPPENGLRFFQGDIFDNRTVTFINNFTPFGCVISDAAPGTSGNRFVDSQRSYQIADRVIDLAEQSLKQGGSLVVKVFQGGDEGILRSRLKSIFREVRVFKPEAVRDESTEIYLVGKLLRESLY